ncbi:MAG: hypothetical protein AAF236_01630, partial [Verrucomicrobiota bacterium]
LVATVNGEGIEKPNPRIIVPWNTRQPGIFTYVWDGNSRSHRMQVRSAGKKGERTAVENLSYPPFVLDRVVVGYRDSETQRDWDQAPEGMKLFEFGIFQRPLDPAEIEELEDELSNRYFVPWKERN